MKKHLYNMKKFCPAMSSLIELTDDVKNHIMNNRIYLVPDPIKIQNQTINNINMITNIVNNMDMVDKHERITRHKQVEVIDFESKVEDAFIHNVKRLENDKFKHGFQLKDNDFYDMINTLTKAIRGPQKEQFLELLNFVYDGKKKRIKVYTSEQWEEHLVDKGLTYLVDTIASFYLETYECYLIRKIVTLESRSPQESGQFLQCLEDYYKFIAAFEVHPFVQDKNDNQVLYNKNDSRYHITPNDDSLEGFSIVDRFSRVFQRVDDALTNAERRATHRKVLDILKTNGKENIEELDKEVIGLIRLDIEFKHMFQPLSPVPI
jgi:hypothetical protein